MGQAIKQKVPVITIDGPTASGKGTVAQRVAEHLGWHMLDSGALYRLAALSCLQQDIDLDDSVAVTQRAATMEIAFKGQEIWLSGHEVSTHLRAEEVGLAASQVAAYESLRDALLQRQRAFRQAPGLVADGRDMGTVIFPDAPLKIFLTASVQARAGRRHKQLIDKGNVVNIEDILTDLKARDERDTQRAIAPLRPAADAFVIDSSKLSIDETVAQVLAYWSNISAKGVS